MIERYTLPAMGAVWTDANRYRKWLDVELAVCEAWAQLGRIPKSSLGRIRRKADFSLEHIEAIEKTVKHDVIAFLTSVAEKVGPDSRYIHMGLTSYDVVDTSLSLLIRDSLALIRKRLVGLRIVLRRQALKHKRTACIGRTHGIHAEPVTFGFKILVWYEEMGRHLERLDRAVSVISTGRISGSVGTYIHLDPRVERIALRKLRLKPAGISTQVLQRDHHAEVLASLALLAAGMETIALEIRHLQRTEVGEVEEPFTKGQKGSSSMPHKKNPVRCERISGLARIIRSHLQVALENIPLWHERDISHSSAERIIFPDAFILTDFLLSETTDIVRNWTVRPDRMMENIAATRGLVFSQGVLLALTQAGMTREEAYLLVQEVSLKAWNENLDFRKTAAADPGISARLSPEEIAGCFSLDPYLAKIDTIYKKVLADES